MRDVFEKAAEVIRERGWHQGGFEKTPGGPCCVGGAVSAAVVGVAHPTGDLVDKVYPYWDDLQLKLGGAYARWNDAPGRTKEEVLALLDELAAST